MLSYNEAVVFVAGMVAASDVKSARRNLSAWQYAGKYGQMPLQDPAAATYAPVPTSLLGTSEELLANVNLCITVWWDLRQGVVRN